MFVQTSSLVNVKVLQNIEMGRMKIHAKFYRIVKQQKSKLDIESAAPKLLN